MGGPGRGRGGREEGREGQGQGEDGRPKKAARGAKKTAKRARAKADKRTDEGDVARCRVCGCTEQNGCPGGCSWLEPDLCDRCEACGDCAEPGAKPECPTVEKRRQASDEFLEADEDDESDLMDELEETAFATAEVAPCRQRRAPDTNGE